MRFPKKKVSARATALALVLGVVGVLLTALPASAAAVTSFTAWQIPLGREGVTGVVAYATCCCSATAVLMNSAMRARVG